MTRTVCHREKNDRGEGNENLWNNKMAEERVTETSCHGIELAEGRLREIFVMGKT